MKQLKSSFGDLRRLFGRTITLRDIAKPLVFSNAAQCATQVQNFVQERELDYRRGARRQS